MAEKAPFSHLEDLAVADSDCLPLFGLGRRLQPHHPGDVLPEVDNERLF
jgi:hypothetical protein